MFSRICSVVKDIVHYESVRRKKYRTFSIRLLLIEAVLFTGIIFAMSSLISYYIRQNEKSKLMQSSRDSLAAITSYYDKKHDNFIDIIMPMYVDANYYNITSRFLENTDNEQLEQDPFRREEIVNMLKWICAHDKDIVALLFHKNSGNRNYLFNVANNSFEIAPASFPLIQQLNDKPPGRLMVGTVEYRAFNNNVKTYGIAATIGSRNLRYDAGDILVLYNVKGLEDEYYKGTSHDNGLFFIFTNQGDVIFSSDEQYYGKKHAYFEHLAADIPVVTIDGIEYYKTVIEREKRDFLSVLLVPSAKVDEIMLSNNVKIFSIAAVFGLLSAVFYFVTGYLISKRVNALIKATERVGSHNLSYRIPINGYNDEYEYISKHFNSMCDELQDNINKRYLYEIKQKNAELREMQACINPHFLYNTLEAIRVQASVEDNPTVNRMILMLASFFRNITKGDTIITIREEIYSCQLYLNLFSLRCQDSLTVDFDIEDDIMDFSILRNLIQPIIENYIIHGFQHESPFNRIVLEGRSDGEEIILSVKDNGTGMPSERLEYVQKMLSSGLSSDRASYGILNVNDRIRLVYGSQYGVSIDSSLNQGTTVTVRLRKVSCEELSNWQKKRIGGDSSD